MQLPAENYIFYRILFAFIFMEILFNIARQLGFSKNFLRPLDKNNP